MGLERFAGALERDGQHLAIHPRQHFFDAGLIERQEILEHEHQMPNAAGGVGIALIYVFQ